MLPKISNSQSFVFKFSSTDWLFTDLVFFVPSLLETLNQGDRKKKTNLNHQVIKTTYSLLLCIHGIVIARQIKVNLVDVYWNYFFVLWHSLASAADSFIRPNKHIIIPLFLNTKLAVYRHIQWMQSEGLVDILTPSE